MAKLILPKTTSAIREAAVPMAGEIFYDSEKKMFFGGDGETVGGVPFRHARIGTQYIYGLDTEYNASGDPVSAVQVVLDTSYDDPANPHRYQAVGSGGFTQEPAHNFHRCLMVREARDGGGYKLAFSKYLNASDSRFDMNGDPVALDGSQGGVHVEIPPTYVRLDLYFDASEHLHEVYLVSNEPFEGAVAHRRCYDGPGGATIRTLYLGAFRSVACDGTTGLVVPQGADADATPVAYNSAYRLRSIATATWTKVGNEYVTNPLDPTTGARPIGNWTRARLRSGHVNEGGTNVSAFFGQWMALMMAIDCGTWNSQSGISDGYCWRSAFAYQDMRATGRTAVFGNGTGSIIADETEGGADEDLATGWQAGKDHIVQFSWRGIEDPYGSQWCFEDGIIMYQDATESFDASGYWCTNDTDRYYIDSTHNYDRDHDPIHGAAGSEFPSAGYTGAEDVWVSHPWPKANGNVLNVSDKDLYPTKTGSGVFGDYFYASSGAGSRVVFRGGSSYNGAYDGASYVTVYHALSITYADFGGRLAAFSD